MREPLTLGRQFGQVRERGTALALELLDEGHVAVIRAAVSKRKRASWG